MNSKINKLRIRIGWTGNFNFFTDYYRVFNVWDSYTYNHCSVTGAQCDILLHYYCVCHCYPGYVMVNERCLKGKITSSHELKNIKLLKTNKCFVPRAHSVW